MPKSTPKKRAAKISKKDPPDILAKVQGIIAGQLKKQPRDIAPGSNLQTDLAADSLDALEIIFLLEEQFDIKIGEDEAKKMVTVQNIVDAVGKKTKTSPA